MKLEVRAWRPGDHSAFLDLHNRCFDVRRSADHWRWLHAAPGQTAPMLTGAFAADGRCLAAHAGVELRMAVGGTTVRSVLCGDVAVAPELRDRGLRSGRLLLSVCREFFAAHGGAGTALLWGFAAPPLQRVLTRHLAMEVVNDVVFAVRDFAQQAAESRPAAVTDALPPAEQIDALWERCRPADGASVVRDAAYLDWRYQRHPQVRNHWLVLPAHGGDRLRGLCIWRRGGWRDDLAQLQEWVVAEDDLEAEKLLLAALAAAASAAGSRGVATWVPTTSALFHRLQCEHGYFAQPTPYQLLARSWSPRLPRAWLHQHWWRTFGDMDFM